MSFLLIIVIGFFLCVKEITVQDCRRLFFNLFYFYYDESITFYCILWFSLFLPKLVDLLGKQRKK